MSSGILVKLIVCCGFSLLTCLSYTCGSRWRTCACTEADQARRDQEIRTRLAQFDADKRAEEEELRAAMVAVEAAERQLQEEREAEEERLEAEQRELERRESGRLEQITEHYDHLRVEMRMLHSLQRQAIESRHNQEWDKLRRLMDSVETKAEKGRYDASEREKLVSRIEGDVKSLQRKQAATIMETITRHRRMQDDLLATSTENEETDNDDDEDVTKAAILQQLMPIQEAERTRLKSKQARELQCTRAHGNELLRAFDNDAASLQKRLDEVKSIKSREREVEKMGFADGKWLDVLFADRTRMLGEDERRLVLSGNEAPKQTR